VKMAETSNIYAVVQADGKYFHAVKEIKVTLGGAEADMADPMRIRANMAATRSKCGC